MHYEGSGSDDAIMKSMFFINVFHTILCKAYNIYYDLYCCLQVTQNRFSSMQMLVTPIQLEAAHRLPYHLTCLEIFF